MSDLVRGGSSGRVIVARLGNKKEVIEEIIKVCKEKGISSGYVNIIGGLQDASLISMKKADTEREYKEMKHEGPFEVMGIGTISRKDKEIVPHIHITLGKFGNEALSGHLVRGNIALFIELVINEIEDINMIRKKDPEIFDLELLNFEE